ncbi:MAG: energy-coupling factor transporter ATPase [Merdibacter sp.]|nr:energy-coupling factor transporter ATPase [Merdibacter sp.]
MKKIEIEHLSFSYDEQIKALDDVSFSIEEGSYTVIVGHNGSGKSTIAKLMIGLMEAQSGIIRVDGTVLKEESVYDIRDKIGIVFQNPDNQFIGATVADDIAFGLENHQVPHDQMQAIIDEFAARVNMSKYLNSEPTKLSGGQKQRVAIAGVLAMRPQILIFDESTSMLDPQGKAEINALVKRIHEETGITIISITHDIEEMVSSDHVIVMKEGKVVMDGTPAEVLNNEEELIKMQLDIPFSLKFVNEMKKQGIVLKREIQMEKVVDELCRLRFEN